MAAPLGHTPARFDNHARPYRTITALPLAAAMGAEITGVDCATVSAAQIAEIEDALYRHKMIFFRGQSHMTHADQSRFSARLGRFAEDAYTGGVPGHPEVQPVIKQADTRTGHIFGSGWHTDSPFLPEPPAISTLRSVEVPPFGGDTMWANSALALAALSETMRGLLAPLKVRMSMARVLAAAQQYGTAGEDPIGRLVQARGEPLSQDLARKVAGTAHPLVRTHPVTGEAALYCDGSYAIGIEGMSEAEAAALLTFLVAHITQPAFTCRLRWEAGMFVLWDNRLCIHQAFNDYDGYRREMYRTTLAGEKPR